MAVPASLRFGTDGWRGVIAKDVTFDAVRLVVRAVAAAFRAGNPSRQHPVLAVGHDTRFLSRRFAQVAAEVLAAEGFDTRLTTSHLPTPVLAWSVPLLAAQGGVMITASHNHPSYNGLKIRTVDGGPATGELTARIEAEILRLGEGRDDRGAGDTFLAGRSMEGGAEPFDPLPPYRKRLATLVNLEIIARSRLRVVIDPMYGAGQGVMATLLRDIGLETEEIHGEIDPWFGGIAPEPLPQHLWELIDRIKALDDPRAVGLAFDGDGDRLVAVDESGSYVTPHQIFALLLRHLVKRRGRSGMVVKTFSTTSMIDLLAEAYGLPLTVTPVGFKHIAEVIRQGPFLIGGEESGGIGVAGHIPERDGVLSALLLLECIATEQKPLRTLVGELETELGPHCFRRLDLKRTRVGDGKELERRMLHDPPAMLDRKRVKDVQSLDGVKFIAEDGSWLLIRGSGTEPVLRLYAEASTEDEVSRLLTWGRPYVERALAVR